MEEGTDETLQETVYALMALNEFDRSAYIAAISDAGIFLQIVQLANGGWENYAAGGENNKFTGEALSGITIAVSVPGDFDMDGHVDLADYAFFGLSWLTEAGDPQWFAGYDIAKPHDGVIDERDLAVIMDNWLVNGNGH